MKIREVDYNNGIDHYNHKRDKDAEREESIRRKQIRDFKYRRPRITDKEKDDVHTFKTNKYGLKGNRWR